MDPLSVTASVIAVLQLTNEVVKYLTDFREAPRECQQCNIEATNLQNLLVHLRYHLEEAKSGDPWFASVQRLGVKNGPLDQYRQALEQLRSKVEVKDEPQKLKRRLLWTFSKGEVASIIGRMERLKNLVMIALQMDHFKLLQAIKEQGDAIPPMMEAIKGDIASVRDTQNRQWDAQELQQLNVMMRWLSTTDNFLQQQHDIISRREKDTGQWFLNSVQFQRWLDGSDKTLFCPGIPGAGKTMMAAIAIDHLCRTTQNGEIKIAYLFCSYKAQVDQSAFNLLTALLKQLIHNRPDMATPVKKMYDQHSKQNSRPSLSEISEALQSVCSAYVTVHIVVDALDECADENGARSKLISRLCELQCKADVRILFTSRSIPEIMQNFQSSSMLKIHASKEDVIRFIEGQIPRLPRCIQHDTELKHAVKSKIIEAVDGMFLLARLYVDTLLDKRNKHKVLSTLDKLSKGSEKLNEAYGEAIKRIDSQLDEDRKLARRILYWISHARRLLKTEELCHALAIEPGDRALNHDKLYEVEEIISVCAGLVTVDEASSTIRLVHYTTQEYLGDERFEWSHGGPEEVAITCLTYLSLDTFRSGCSAGEEEFDQRLAENVFFSYSANHWLEHIRPVEHSASVSSSALVFLQDDALVQSTARYARKNLMDYHQRWERTGPYGMKGLHIVAKYGLSSLSKTLIKGEKQGDINAGIDSVDEVGRTPLSYAAENGHVAVVRQLLDTGKVDLDSGTRRGLQTPLSYAAFMGHEAIVRLLLDTGEVDIDSNDYSGRTPLSYAAEMGSTEVVRLLLDTGEVDIDSRDKVGRTPISYAMELANVRIVGLLLETGEVNVNSKNKWGQTPLHYAAVGGKSKTVKLLHGPNKANPTEIGTYNQWCLSKVPQKYFKEVVRLLLDTGKVKVDSKDRWGWTPLHYAIIEDSKEIVQLLLDTGEVNVNSKNKWGGTPLHCATEQGSKEVVRLLLETGKVNINSKDEADRTPLHYAAKRGYKEVVQLLLNTGEVNVDSKDMRGWTPLLHASDKGHEAVVRQLLDIGKVDLNSGIRGSLQTSLSFAASKGHEAIVGLFLDSREVNVNSKDRRSRTPLSYAVEGKHKKVVRLLLGTSEVNVNSKDELGRTPLHYAAKVGSTEVVRLLLGTGKVNVDSKDKAGRTPMFYAIEWNSEEIVRLFLETGEVNVNSKDKWGRTPLRYAIVEGSNEVVRLLLGTGEVNVNSKDNWGRTPLHYAAKQGSKKVLKPFFKTGKVNVNPKDESDRILLHYAIVEQGFTEIVQLLLDYGKVDVNSKDNWGLTPLHYAEARGYKEVIGLLLDTGGIDINSKDEFDKTALQFAAEGDEEMVVSFRHADEVDTNLEDIISEDDRDKMAFYSVRETVVSFRHAGEIDTNSEDGTNSEE